MDSPSSSAPPSPDARRMPSFLHPSSSELTSRRHGNVSEITPLLAQSESSASARRFESSTSLTSPNKPRVHRFHSSGGTLRSSRHHSRTSTWREAHTGVTGDPLSGSMHESKSSIRPDDRVWYDQFTSTDWVHDSIADAYRVKALRSRKDFRGRLQALFDGSQGWILSALVGCVTAAIAYAVNVSEAPVFDVKVGFCADGWYKSEKKCCPHGGHCEAWKSWSDVFAIPHVDETLVEFVIYCLLVILLAVASCLLTLLTKTVVPSAYQLSTLDENLAAVPRPGPQDSEEEIDPKDTSQSVFPPMTYYSAAGSGVAEVRVILSGFVLHGFLGLKTLLIKTLALVLAVASGLSLGKEGPFVHIATCVGNIACRLFSKYDKNDGKRREVLSAATASGVTVAFGAPIAGVLFGLEETSYFFPAKTLFRTFFCCITAALTLKFLNPYGNNKIVLFEVRFLTDWEFFEIFGFIFLGVLGGAAGALFIKASRFWARSFRKIPAVKKWPLLEVFLVALITGPLSYWNPYTREPVAKLLYNLASPCDPNHRDEMGLCPEGMSEIMPVVKQLLVGFVIKSFLTIITFGIKVPAGIYVPSMVVGGLMGRAAGHIMQWIVLRFPNHAFFEQCAFHPSGTSCITPGVYALIAAGSTMCGVTRLSVTLAVVLFELTGSLDYVLPFSLAILVSKWTADFIEPLSIYDLLTNMNSYPFLNNKHKPIFTGELADITPRFRKERIIDISTAPMIPATILRQKLNILHRAGELDGGLPIIRHDVLVGLIPAPDLEFALDRLQDEERSLCLMADVNSFDDSDDENDVDPTDFTPYIDPAPIALDIRSPLDLVYECFVKLGLRYICVVRDGAFAGMIHKKVFTKYLRELEEKEKHH